MATITAIYHDTFFKNLLVNAKFLKNLILFLDLQTKQSMDIVLLITLILGEVGECTLCYILICCQSQFAVIKETVADQGRKIKTESYNTETLFLSCCLLLLRCKI